jgi:hypothetical protein
LLSQNLPKNDMLPSHIIDRMNYQKKNISYREGSF